MSVTSSGGAQGVVFDAGRMQNKERGRELAGSVLKAQGSRAGLGWEKQVVTEKAESEANGRQFGRLNASPPQHASPKHVAMWRFTARNLTQVPLPVTNRDTPGKALLYIPASASEAALVIMQLQTD